MHHNDLFQLQRMETQSPIQLQSSYSYNTIPSSLLEFHQFYSLSCRQQVSRTGPMPIAYPLTLFLKASSSTPTRYFHKSQVLDIIVQHCGFDKTACHALQILTKKLTLGLLEKQCNFENLCYVYVIGTGGKFLIFFLFKMQLGTFKNAFCMYIFKHEFTRCFQKLLFSSSSFSSSNRKFPYILH